MHIIDTIEVALWKTKVRNALGKEQDEKEHADEEGRLKQESIRLEIKIPDILIRSTARIIP